MCVSCAWSKPEKPNPAEFCENGAKATAWDLTRHRCTPEFFAQHTLTELRDWKDFDLEHQGRLTAPMKYDPATDKYFECRWSDAFAEIGRELKALDPKSVIFYASGRASLETSYMYGIFARMYGCNNLPDSSNMCHEFDIRRLETKPRRAGRHREARGFRKDRLHPVLRPECRVEQPAHASRTTALRQTGRSDHHLQSAARTRPRRIYQSAVADPNGDGFVDQHQHAVLSIARRQRHRGDDGDVQMADRA